MRLIAFIAASAPVDDDADGDLSDLRALVPVAGQSVLERQVHNVVAMGAELVLVQVAAMPPALTAAFDRIRARGIEIVPIRRAADLLPHLLTEDRVLLVADGLHAATAHYRALAQAAVPAVLVTGDLAITQVFERIDATTRWAGLAVVSGAEANALADLPADWDLVLTLLRRAVQLDGRRIACDPAMFAQGEIAVISDAAMAAPLERRAMQRVEFGGMGLGSASVVMPLIRLAGPLLLKHRRLADAMPWAVLTMMAAALLLAALGLPGGAAVSAVAACFCIGALRFLRSFRAESGLVSAVRIWGRRTVIALLAAVPLVGVLATETSWDGLAPFGRLALVLVPAAALVQLIALARLIFMRWGQNSVRAWLLPDAEAAWLLLTPLSFVHWAQWTYWGAVAAAPLLILLWLRANPFVAEEPVPLVDHDAV